MTIIFKLEPRNVFTRSSDGKVIFTYSDIESLPEWPETPVVEIIGGDLFMAPSPTVNHQRISGELAFLLKDHVKKNDLGEILSAPVDVVFSELDVCVPDILFISKERNYILTKKNVQGTPDLIIEILSSNRDLDLVRKKAIYEKYGVMEYWIVDPEEKKIQVHIMSKNNKQFNPPVIYTENDVVPGTVIPSFRIHVKNIFKST
ncbi:MAG: Uma2 family endonuclease [Candidatus Sigynarchaeota archaeon]